MGVSNTGLGSRLGVIGGLACGALLTAAVPARANLLLNGSFNTDANADGLPDGWGRYVYNDATGNGVGYASYNTSPTDPHTYDGSPFINAGNAGGYGNGEGGWNQIVAGVAGHSYTVSIDSGTEDFAFPNGTMRLIYMTAASSEISRDVVDVTSYKPNLPYAHYAGTFTAPAGTALLKVEYASGYRGTTFFDNASLIDNTVAVPEPTSLGALAVGSVMLRRRRR